MRVYIYMHICIELWGLLFNSSHGVGQLRARGNHTGSGLCVCRKSESHVQNIGEILEIEKAQCSQGQKGPWLEQTDLHTCPAVGIEGIAEDA